MIFTGGWVCDGLRMLDLFDGQVNKYSKVLAPKATLTRIWVKSVRYKDQECTEKYGLNLIFKGIVLTPKQKKNDTFQEMLPCWFSHLCQATQLTKGELWAAVKRQLPASDFPPPECQLFYICSTMQLVDLCEFQTGNHPLLTFWKGTSMYHQGGFPANLFFRWLRWVARCAFGGDAFEGVPLPFPLPRSPPAAGTEALQLWPKSYVDLSGFPTFQRMRVKKPTL